MMVPYVLWQLLIQQSQCLMHIVLKLSNAPGHHALRELAQVLHRRRWLGAVMPGLAYPIKLRLADPRVAAVVKALSEVQQATGGVCCECCSVLASCLCNSRSVHTGGFCKRCDTTLLLYLWGHQAS
ncbi:hypothetical protein V8C86DRAFT_2951467 [Haematococcus lacustris]